MPAHSRHLKLLGVAALAALVALLVASCGGSKHTHSATTVATVPTVKPAPRPRQRPSLITVFGDPARLLTAPGPTLDTYRTLGVDYIRVTVPFAGLVADPKASSPPAGFDASSPSSYLPEKWAPYDNI